MTVSRHTARLRRQLSRLRDDFPTEAEALRRRAFWRLATRFTPTVAVERQGMRLFVSTQDQILGRRLFVYHRTPELDIVAAFDALRLIPGGAAGLAGRSVLEIGANIGSHTVELIKHYEVASVVAIEPHPGNCGLLRQNVMVNGVADRVHLLELALSDRDGSVSLEVSPENSGDHRVRVDGTGQDGARRSGAGRNGAGRNGAGRNGSARNGAAREAGRATISVRAARFDTLVETGEIDLAGLGLTWMDAQGHEAHILLGARSLLDSGVPIMMEYWPYGLRRAGGLEQLHALVAEHYSHVIDIGAPNGPRVLPAGDLPSLEAAHGWGEVADEMLAGTDLILSHEVR